MCEQHLPDQRTLKTQAGLAPSSRAEARFGYSVNHYAVDDLVQHVNAVSDAAITQNTRSATLSPPASQERRAA